MNDNHWYPRDPQRYLTDTAWCDYATEVAHVRMIDTYYALGRPIADCKEEIQNIGKIKDHDYIRVTGNLMRLGWWIENGVWRHKRIETTMAEMETNRLAQINRTKAATAARLKNVTSNVTSNVTLSQPQPQPQPQLEPEKQPLREGAKAPSPRFQKPTSEEIRFECGRIGLPEPEGCKFFNFYESKGWKVGKSPMTSWRHALTNWRTRWEVDRKPVNRATIAV